MSADTDIRFGIDIGGTGMKGAPVDLSTGELAGERFRIPTPHPATPNEVADVAREIVDHFDWDGPVGICMPSVVQRGIVRTAANIDTSWIGVDGQKLFSDAVGRPIDLVNDADAAAIAEMRWGAGKGQDGVVICLTFGTGIGSGMFVDGVLVPNTELGHLEMRGKKYHDGDAEYYCSARAREHHDLSWHKWAKQVSHYLQYVDALFSPELIILSGGVSKHADKWVPDLEVDCRLEVAKFLNNAGIAGAALNERLHEPE